MKLRTSRLIFDEFENDDVIILHQLHSLPEVDRYNTLGIPQSVEETQLHLEKIINAQSVNPRSKYSFKVSLTANNQFIGEAGITNSNNRFKLGEIYYNLMPDHWGKGLATEIAKELIRFGFEELKLHKVEAGVQTENTASIKVLEKAGMTREGLRRKILPIRGEWKDNFHYAITEDDPRPI